MPDPILLNGMQGGLWSLLLAPSPTHLSSIHDLFPVSNLLHDLLLMTKHALTSWEIFAES